MQPNPSQIADLPLGAHLTTPRWGYVHHGIHAGGGRVIHYAGFNRPLVGGPVEEVPIERFARGRAVHVKSSPLRRFAGADAVERARSRLGERRYRFWSNNCEHFAYWCISGQSRSVQVDAWKARVRGLLAVFRVPLAGGRLGRRIAG